MVGIKLIMSRFQCPNVEHNEIRIEENNGSGHIPLAFLSIPLMLMSYYSAFFPVSGILPR